MQKQSKILIAANWKMNVLPTESKALAISITDIEWPAHVDVLICPPFTHLMELQSIRTDGILLGAQNCHDKSKGAFTGEVSAEMLMDLKCDYVIIGHSERRMMNPNENKEIHSKIKSAIAVGLKVIYCCGESKAIRDRGEELDFISKQLQDDLFQLPIEAFNKLAIAYEPIWAIGTGINATPEQANKMHQFIKTALIKHFQEPALISEIKILYGGSVNASNAASLAAKKEIDGVLVGGASLIPQEFKAIIKAFSERL